jgi:hypothetical protein
MVLECFPGVLYTGIILFSDRLLGLLSVSAGDRIGMVGLFSGLVKTIRNAGAELIIIEKIEQLIKKFHIDCFNNLNS